MPLFLFDMKEKNRVRLSIVLWVVVAMAFLCCGVVAYQRIEQDEAEPSVAPDTVCVDPESVGVNASQLNHIAQLVDDEPTPICDVRGLAVAVVRNDNLIYDYGYGTLAGEIMAYGMGGAMMNVLVMQAIEKGYATLDGCVEILQQMEHPYDIMGVAPEHVLTQLFAPLAMEHSSLCGEHNGDCSTTMENMSRFVAMILDGGQSNNHRLLSRCGVDAMLTPSFGWNPTSYASLLGSSAVEYCGEASAIIIDKATGIGIIVVADLGGEKSAETFTSLRSRIASVVAAAIR